MSWSGFHQFEIKVLVVKLQDERSTNMMVGKAYPTGAGTFDLKYHVRLTINVIVT